MQPQQTAGERPVKVRIADEIRIRIENGDLPPGAAIPTIGEMTARWNTSPRTARDAHALLRQMGLVTGRRGSALRVRTPPRVAVRSSARHQAEKDMVLLPEPERARVGTSEIEMSTPIDDLDFRTSYEQVAADADIAAVLGVPAGSMVLRRTFETADKRSGARQAWSVSYMPVELIKGNPALLDPARARWPGGTQHQLSTVGIEIMTITDEVTSAMPTTVDQQLWELEDGVPLLRVRRISADGDGRAVEVSDAVFPADRTKLVFPTSLSPWRT